MSFVSCPQKNRNKRRDQLYLNKYFEKIFRNAANQKRSINFLTLPAQEWIHEESIVEAFPEYKFCFWGCENNETVHSLASEKAQELTDKYRGRASFKMTHNPCKLSKALIRDPRTGISVDHCFDIIYADYTGFISPRVMDDIDMVLSSPLNSGPRSVFALTVGLKARNMFYFVQELIEKWRKHPEFKKVEVDDFMFWDRVDNPQLSSTPTDSARALAMEIKQRAETNSKNRSGNFKIKDPHIYYSTRNYGNCAPQIPMGTFAWERKI